MSGFTAKAMVVSDKQDNLINTTQTAGEKNLTGTEFALQFAQGPIAAAVSFGTYEGNGTLATNLTITGSESATVFKQDVLSANASYDLGMAKLFAKYANAKAKQDGGSATTDAAASTTVIGVRAPASSKVTLFANYAMGDYESASGTTKFDDVGYQLGLEYALSKRTKTYAIYGATKTDLTPTTSEKDTQFAFGLIHNF
jgi:predicted porin